MKKIVLIIYISVLTFALTACTSNTKTEAEEVMEIHSKLSKYPELSITSTSVCTTYENGVKMTVFYDEYSDLSLDNLEEFDMKIVFEDAEDTLNNDLEWILKTCFQEKTSEQLNSIKEKLLEEGSCVDETDMLLTTLEYTEKELHITAKFTDSYIVSTENLEDKLDVFQYLSGKIQEHYDE